MVDYARWGLETVRMAGNGWRCSERSAKDETETEDLLVDLGYAPLAVLRVYLDLRK